MKERPILFNGEMVRAILDGRKTQTRRPVKPQPPADIDSLHHGRLASLAPYKLLDDDYNPQGFGFEDGRGQFWKSPFGTVGDRLWVRETTCIAPRRFAEPDETCVTDSGGFKRYVSYKADRHSEDAMRDYNLKWTPSIHVPRWASRIDLEITRVWVERVQDITEEDAKKEGVKVGEDRSYSFAEHSLKYEPHKDAFRDLWQSIYGTCAANPWVWAYEFRRIKP